MDSTAELVLKMIENLEFTAELLAAEALFTAAEKRRRYFAVRVFFSLAVCFGISGIADYSYFLSYSFGIIVRCVAILILSMLCLGFCFQWSGYQLALWGIGAYMVQNMAFAVHEAFKAFWMVWMQQFRYTLAVDFISWAFVFGGVYLLCYIYFVRKVQGAEYAADKKKAALMGAGMLFIVVVLSSYGHELEGADIIWFRLLSVLGCIMGFAVMAELLNNRRLERELDMIQRHEALQKNYYELLKENIEDTNIRCHDLKHQLARFRTQTQNGESISEKAVRDMEQAINIYDAVAKTGNEDLDTVLTEKSLICNRESIRFTYMADSEKISAIEPEDIFCLFGNALDNAIEAVRRVHDPQKRVINLSAVCEGPFLNIKISNYFEGNLELREGMPITTKQDKLAHGYGIKSMERTVEKYGGEMKIQTDEGIFELDIVIPLEKKKAKMK